MTLKHGFWIGIALGFSFVLGCGAAVTLIPPAAAQSTPRYEYLTIDGHGWDDGRWANEAGREGWRFVGFDRGAMDMIFERELH